MLSNKSLDDAEEQVGEWHGHQSQGPVSSGQLEGRVVGHSVENQHQGVVQTGQDVLLLPGSGERLWLLLVEVAAHAQGHAVKVWQPVHVTNVEIKVNFVLSAQHSGHLSGAVIVELPFVKNEIR
jgi:hypothetical protein